MTSTGRYALKRVLCHLFSGGIAVMLCIPHRYWNNRFAVCFSAVSAAVCFFFFWEERSTFRQRRAIELGAAAFLLLCFLSPLWSAYPLAGLRVAVFYLAAAALGWSAALLFSNTAEETQILGKSIYTALLLTSLYGIWQYVRGGENYAVPLAGRLLPRLSSTLEHGINYSEFTAMAFPPAVVWAAEREKKRQRIVFLGLLLFPAAACLLTYSRTGYVSLALALILLFRPWKKPLVLIPCVLLSGLFLPFPIRQRMMSMLVVTDESASGRFTLWKECLSLWQDHRILGAGLGSANFRSAYLPRFGGTLPFTPPHANMGYLEILFSLGLAGGVSFVLFFFGIFPPLHRAIRKSTGRDKLRLRALQASLAGAALANIPEHLWFYPRTLFFWSVLYGLAYRLSLI